jgi:ABC-type phosphate/phosphonate transport system substrate-binding protein
MCGWPFSRADRAMQPIAAPIPSPARYEGRPRYRSEFLVREPRGWTTIDETFGRRIGWMAVDSQSGFNAPRHFLAAFARGKPLYAESRGPYVTPMKTLDALRDDEVDVVALDGFFLDLLRRHDPGRLDGVRTVAETAWTPIPLLVHLLWLPLAGESCSLVPSTPTLPVPQSPLLPTESLLRQPPSLLVDPPRSPAGLQLPCA